LAAIELYLVFPISPAERTELIAQAVAHIRGSSDKTIALEAVDAMLHADGTTSPGEIEVAQEVRAAFASVDVSIVATLGRTLGTLWQQRPGREQEIELWRTNPVAYYLHAHPDGPIGADRPEVRVAALAAGIMAQVVRVTPTNAERERPVLVEALLRDWHMGQEQAEQIVKAALAISRRDVDYHRIARELVAHTEEAQRVQLLDTLFTITNTVDRVSQEELDLIRVIANRFHLTQQQFIAAKLKIAPEDRGGQ
jgi:uncharacterized tellurite resistance protein B-like protein